MPAAIVANQKHSMRRKRLARFWFFYPLTWFVFLFPVGVTLIWLAQSFPRNPVAAHAYWLLFPAHFVAMLALLFDTIVIGLDMKSRSLDRKTHWKWCLAFAFFTLLAIPLYWSRVYNSSNRKTN